MSTSTPRLALAALVALAAIGCAGGGSSSNSASGSSDSVPNCFPPGAPEIPDGSKASNGEMIVVQQRMKLFLESANIYTTCMDDRIKRFGARVPERRREKWGKEQQKVAESRQTAINRFNESVRAYKARVGAAAPQEPSPEPVTITP